MTQTTQPAPKTSNTPLPFAETLAEQLALLSWYGHDLSPQVTAELDENNVVLRCENRTATFQLDPHSCTETLTPGWEHGPRLVSDHGEFCTRYRTSLAALMYGLLPMTEMQDGEDFAGLKTAAQEAGLTVLVHSEALRFKYNCHLTPMRLEHPDGRFLLGALRDGYDIGDPDVISVSDTLIGARVMFADEEEHTYAALTAEQRKTNDLPEPDPARFVSKRWAVQARTLQAMLESGAFMTPQEHNALPGRVPDDFYSAGPDALSPEQNTETLARLEANAVRLQAAHAAQRAENAKHPKVSDDDLPW